MHAVVSTLLEILDFPIPLFSVYVYVGVSTLLEILAAVRHQVARDATNQVSTLLEILGGFAGQTPLAFYYVFQPFLRFWVEPLLLEVRQEMVRFNPS